MLGTVKKFIADRKGAFAMQFALMVVPLTVCTGLAIDGGRAFLARYELASALDAAALAVGSTYNEDTDLNIVAHSFVNANFHTPHNGPIELTLDVGEDDDDIVLLKGKVKIDTYFMPLVGQSSVTVSAESQVRRGGNNVEVALALDITESMSGTRITALKEAARDLIDTVVSDVQTPYFSKVAIVPWGNNVHVGADLADDIRGPLTGPTAVSGVEWRDGTAKTITAASSGWRKVAGGNSISSSGSNGATWRSGSRLNISTITALGLPANRIQVTTSAAHSYADGDTVHISNITNGSYQTLLNGNKYKVADRTTTAPYTFTLQTIGTTTYVAPPTGLLTNSTTGNSQKCFNTGCEVRITTSSSNAFVSGDYVHISGVGSPYGFVNNANDSPWTVSSLTTPTSTQFFLAGSNGPSVTSTSSGGGGTASECYNSTCKYVVTATSHGLSNNDRYVIYGVSSGGSGSGTSLNTASGSWSVEDATSNTFTLAGEGQSYKDWSSGGSVAECLNSGCTVKVTSVDHGLSSGQYVRITSVGGPTGINNGSNASWQISSVSGNDLWINTWGPGLTNAHVAYTSSTGSAQCLASGCLQYRYTDNAGGTKIGTASNCVTERTDADEAYTDAAPSDAFAGPHYPASDSLTHCNSANSVMPLSSDKTALKNHITNMDLSGSTAGQIGAAWGWYMISPEWGYLWPADINRPKEYGTKELAKVVVFMTDGEFNTAHCQGVQSAAYGYSGIANSSRINCSPTQTPFEQAEDFCDAMRADGKDVIIYTVGFELAAGSPGEDFLEYCATDEDHVFLAANSTELKAAFKAIATSISRLRIAR
jgi:Flp pilus assembly protein TadG